jgi:peptidoglycan-N-acetylglucosamine deacetylase
VIAAIVTVVTALTMALVGATALLTRSVLTAGVPIHVWVWLAVAIDALLLYAVFERRAPLFGRIASRARPRTPAIAITFDDGPTEPYTSQILDVLRSFEARATFFVLGARATTAPLVLARAVEEGHEIGNHTWNHAALALRTPRFIRETIRRTSDLVQEATGIRPAVFRAPFGWRNPWVDGAARKEGCEPVAWSVGVNDTDRPGADVIAERAIAGLKDGAILLLHDGRSLDSQPDASQVVEALPRVLRAARDRSLRLLTVSELLAESRAIPGIGDRGSGIDGKDWPDSLSPIAGPGRGITRWHMLLLAVVLAVAAALLARSDPGAIVSAFAAMSWRWAALAALINLLGVMIDAARWRIIVNSVGRISIWHACQAQLVGIVGNVLFPFKLGEGARAYMLKRRGELPAATALTTVLLDRVMDGLTLPLFVVIASLLLPLPPSVLRARTWMLVVLIVAAAAGVAFASWIRDGHAAAEGPLASAAGRLSRILAGMTVLSHHGRAASTIAVALLSWIARAAIIWCMLRAFHLPLPASAAVSVLVIVNLGIALVATPGNVGSFELTTAAALALWGVAPETALSVAIATHAIEVAPPVLLGLAAYVRSG